MEIDDEEYMEEFSEKYEIKDKDKDYEEIENDVAE